MRWIRNGTFTVVGPPIRRSIRTTPAPTRTIWSKAARAWSIVLGNDYEKFATILAVEFDRKAERVRR